MFRYLKFFFMLLVIFSSLFVFGENKVLDLGEIEIKGEVRRPNINLIYSKKYINEAMLLIVRKELQKLEKELLKPSKVLPLKRKAKRKKKVPAVKSNKQ